MIWYNIYVKLVDAKSIDRNGEKVKNNKVYTTFTYETNALCFIKEILKDEQKSIFE